MRAIFVLVIFIELSKNTGSIIYAVKLVLNYILVILQLKNRTSKKYSSYQILGVNQIIIILIWNKSKRNLANKLKGFTKSCVE